MGMKSTTIPTEGKQDEKSSSSDLGAAEPLTKSNKPSTGTEKSEPQVHLTDENSTENDEYISGIKLLLIVGVVSLSMFTMLLDTSIIVTVS